MTTDVTQPADGNNGSARIPVRGEVTAALIGISEGRSEAQEELLQLVYGELRKTAAAYLRRRSGNTLCTTDLVHETYLHLFDHERMSWSNRRHFFGSAARAMRQVLVDHERRRRALKRIPGKQLVPLEVSPEPAFEPDLDILALNQALEQLGEANQRQAQVVELRFFGGLTEDETAEVLGVSRITVARDWRLARLKLSHLINR